MDILLAGGMSFFVDAMIDKLAKEGHHVYVLSGNKYNIKKYKRAFEQYDFAYDSSVLHEIIESVNPDMVLFFGAYDTNFSKDANQQQMVSYTTGLINLLMCLSALSKQVKFIYLSSQDVFQNQFERGITERDLPKSIDPYAMTIRQGEQTCLNYQKGSGVEPYVLRLDHVYGMPNGLEDFYAPLNSMVNEGLHFQKINANENHYFHLLGVGDAVQHIYRFMLAETPNFQLYHISSYQGYTEGELADFVAKGLSTNLQIQVDKRDFGQESGTTLLAERFNQEFDVVYRDCPEKTIPYIAKTIRKRQKKFYGAKKERKPFGNRIVNQLFMILQALIPYVENTILFIPFFMLNNRAVGSQYFDNLDFYLLYVLLFAIAFGQQQAMYSAILATTGYIFRQQYTRSSFEVILDYNTYVWIAQLFILGLVVGYLKDRLKSIRGEDEREIAYLRNQMDDIAEINRSNVQIKKLLEHQIINQNDSFGRIYEITSTLDHYATEEVLFYATEVVAELIHSEDVAIYSISNGDYARLFAATSDKARSLGNSIRYKELKDMYRELEQDKVYINKTMDTAYPLMADAIYSEDHMEMIIMAWGIPWDRMNLSQANMLRIIGYLIQNAALRADRYMEALETQRYRSGTHILETTAFQSLLKAYIEASHRGLTYITILHMQLGQKTIEEAGVELNQVLRTSDYMGQLEDGQLYIMLSNTDLANAKVVLGRFQSMGYNATVVELEDLA